jgi:hypothetical protein
MIPQGHGGIYDQKPARSSETPRSATCPDTRASHRLAEPGTGAELDRPGTGTGAADGTAEGSAVPDAGTDGTGDGSAVPDGGTGAGVRPDGTGDGSAVPDGGTGAGVRPDGVAEAWAAASVSRAGAGWLAATARPAPPATRAATGRPSQVSMRLREVLMVDNLRFSQPR